MKVKVGDFVVVRLTSGKIIEVSDDKVRWEIQDDRAPDGVRYLTVTKEMADRQGLTLDQMVDRYILKAELKE